MNNDLEAFQLTIRLAEQMLKTTSEMNQHFTERAVVLEKAYKALTVDFARMKVLFEVEAELGKMEEINEVLDKQIAENLETLDRNALLFLQVNHDAKEREEVLKVAYNGRRTLERSREELRRLRNTSEHLLTEMLAI